MAPPGRGDTPQREDSLAELGRAGLDEASGSRLSGTANQLASWVEWLRHPEDHGYDRTLTDNNEEVPGPVLDSVSVPGPVPPQPPQPHPSPAPVSPDAQWPFESVIAKYNLAQFLDGMAAVATQQVERESSVLAPGAAVMKNVWWLGDARVSEMQGKFPSKEEWDSDAAELAKNFIAELSTVAGQANKIIEGIDDKDGIHGIPAQYALIIKTTRDNFEKLAADFVKACEAKFHSKDAGVSIDVIGIMASTVAAGAMVFVTRGAVLPLIAKDMIESAWSATFTEFFKALAGAAKDDKQGTVHGPLWRDLATSYMVTHSDITNRTIGALNDLTGKIKDADAQFEKVVRPYLDKWATGPAIS